MESEELQDGGRRWSGVVMVLVVALIISVVGIQTMSVAASDDLRDYVDRSEEWCDSRDGQLVNSRVIGPHGGLHCELPNGTSVHMSEVVGDSSD